MRYITDEHKNITHVLVPIDEWNGMLEKQGEDNSINPYQPVIEWIEETLKAKSPIGITPPLIGLSAKMAGQDLFANMPTYNMLRTILQKRVLESEVGSIVKKNKTLQILLSQMYPFALKADTMTIAIAYILRNNEFYTALHNTNEGVSSSDAKILKLYGFDIEKFNKEASKTLLTSLYSGNQSEFVFTALNENIVNYFNLVSIKERVRREPETLRLFFYDLFNTLDEVLEEDTSFHEIFKKYPLVDRLAKVIYPNNTLSGSTSRVYKAAKEARTIIANDWQNYVSVK